MQAKWIKLDLSHTETYRHLYKSKLFMVKLCLMRHHKNGTLSKARRHRLANNNDSNFKANIAEAYSILYEEHNCELYQVSLHFYLFVYILEERKKLKATQRRWR